MGKYMRKSSTKAAADVAVMEVSGVRTRAKTLALQRSSSSYLQLRSRRLEKPPLLFSLKKHHNTTPKPQNPKQQHSEEADNVLDLDRTTRESTPCSLIRGPDTIRTPGSTTRPTNSGNTNRRIQASSQQHIPTAHDMDEFFADAEEKQQKQFIDKYNFDPVNDKLLPGRYEWEKLDL